MSILGQIFQALVPLDKLCGEGEGMDKNSPDSTRENEKKKEKKNKIRKNCQ